jgi:hypothetical protein
MPGTMMRRRRLPPELFHYTSAQGLLGIVESGVIRASDTRFVNDSAEIQFGIEALKEDLRRNVRVRSAENSAWNAVVDSAINQLRPVPDVPVFVASFTELKDDLSQWRGYCPMGGYAIGFDPGAISERALDQGFSFGDCTYGERPASELADRLHRVLEYSEHVGAFQKLDEKYGPEPIPAYELSAGGVPDLNHGETYTEAALIKHSSFEAEREWRAVRVGAAPETLGFRDRKGTLVPFFEFVLTDSERLPITSIRSAPTPDSSTAADVLSLFVKKHSARLGDVRREVSGSTYRAS